MWNTRRSDLSEAELWRRNPGAFRHLPAALPALPQPLDNQRMGGGSLEIRPLPALLSPGTDHLERTVLSSTALDCDYATLRRHALPLPGMPLQFRKFSPVQGKAQLAGWWDRAGNGRAVAGQALTQCCASVAGKGGPRNSRWRGMTCFALYVRRVGILVLWVSASALAQVPYQRPQTPPEPRRGVQPRAGNHLRKVVRANKVAPPRPGQRGAGLPKRRSLKTNPKMKNGSK